MKNTPVASKIKRISDARVERIYDLRSTEDSVVKYVKRIPWSFNEVFEVETLPRGRAESEYEHQALFSRCRKKEDHEKFIHVDSFRIHHLSKKFRDKDLFKCLVCLCKVTVKIVVNKGRSLGTGRIRYVNESREDEPCPCDECKDVEKPRRPWWKVGVVTATHVITGDKQAQNRNLISSRQIKRKERTILDLAKYAECIIGYDNDACVTDKVVGVGVSKHGMYVNGDRFNLCCVTHDRALAARLRKDVDLYKEMCIKVSTRVKHNKEDLKLAVVVSHPHGGPKKVTVGEWMDKHVIQNEGFTAYTYQICTCPGSSGAPVYIPDRKGLAWCTHPHSTYDPKDRQGCSGYGY